jgi:hypothetical protein
MDAALKLTPAQRSTFNELRQAMGQLTRSHRAELQEIVQESERAKPVSEREKAKQ